MKWKQLEVKSACHRSRTVFQSVMFFQEKGRKDKWGPMQGGSQHHAPSPFSILRRCSAGWHGGYSRYRMLGKASGVRSQADLALNFPFTPMSYAILGKMPELSGHNFPTQETVKIRPLHENSAHWSTTVSGPLGFMTWGSTEKGMGKFCSTHSCWVLYKLKSKSRVCGAKIMPRCPTLFFCWVWGEQESRNTGQSKGPWEVWIIVSRSTAWLLAGWGWKLQRLCWLSFANQPDGNLHISGKRDS